MIVEREHQVLLEMIRRSQFGSWDNNCDYSNVNWDYVYSEANRQAIIGLVAPEINQLNLDADGRWKQTQYKQTANYVKYNHEEKQLGDILDREGIPFVILKGNAAAIYYKRPSRRTMGDIDLLVPQDLFVRAKTTLISNGYITDHTEDDVSTRRHIGFKKNGILFELHHHYSHNETNIEDYVIDGLNNRITAQIEGHTFPLLPSIANGLVLLDHMASHLRSGMGLRQAIDWMMYVNKELDDDVWNFEFKQIAQEKGLSTLAIIATRMCQLYLGLPSSITWCKDADKTICDQLMESLLKTGNFGHKHGSGVIVEKIGTNIKSHGLFRWLQYAGECNWKAYHKHHWLKPFCWLFQICHYGFKGFKSGRSSKQLTDDLKRSNDRYELMKKIGIG